MKISGDFHVIVHHLVSIRKRSRGRYDALLELGVIKKSQATEWSQVHLVTKPTPEGQPQKWRFTLDFVRLNSATGGLEGWPIPNIQQIINRIGTLKPKVFGIIYILILKNTLLSSLSMDCLNGTE